MFFDDLTQIPRIATRTECAIFVLPQDILSDGYLLGTPPQGVSADDRSSRTVSNGASSIIALKHALTLAPSDDTKTPTITVEQVREFIALTNSRETADRFFVICPADAMNEAAQNAFLKTLEEPKPFCHFVLLTANPSALLPTILSRAQTFFLRRGRSKGTATKNSADIPAESPLDSAPVASAKTLALARRLVSAGPQDLPGIALELTKSKTNTRETALAVVATTIEILYKSYFKTNNPKFLTKLPGFITLYDNLAKNGHIKLHIVADLL